MPSNLFVGGASYHFSIVQSSLNYHLRVFRMTQNTYIHWPGLKLIIYSKSIKIVKNRLKIKSNIKIDNSR